MTFPLNGGLRVVDQSSSQAALGQIVFQAQIDFRHHVSTLHQHPVFLWFFFWKVEGHLDKNGSLRYFRVEAGAHG